jgi:DNA/RNA-binding domain of Phe-tRNA-synthetase-like protein
MKHPGIEISEQIKELWPPVAIGVLFAQVEVMQSPGELVEELKVLAQKLQGSMKVGEISGQTAIQQGRKAYKAFGKAPARYRLSSEALLRRTLKGQGMYFVNNIVEINNLVSMESQMPICAFDLDQVGNQVVFRLGRKEETYYGIGRGQLNIENLPVFADSEGAFGSPTSDSERVKITERTKNLNMNLISFQDPNNLESYLNRLAGLLQTYAHAKEITTRVIG